jgi:hypothetical protein
VLTSVWPLAERPLQSSEGPSYSMTIQARLTTGARPDHEHKRAAVGHITEAWAEARVEGIDGDCLAQACLFAAFIELVKTYGEEAASRFAEGLPDRIRNGEFSLNISKQ